MEERAVQRLTTFMLRGELLYYIQLAPTCGTSEVGSRPGSGHTSVCSTKRRSNLPHEGMIFWKELHASSTNRTPAYLLQEARDSVFHGLRWRLQTSGWQPLARPGTTFKAPFINLLLGQVQGGSTSGMPCRDVD